MAAPDRTDKSEQFCESSCLQIHGLRPEKSQPLNRIGKLVLGKSQPFRRIVFMLNSSSRQSQSSASHRQNNSKYESQGVNFESITTHFSHAVINVTFTEQQQERRIHNEALN